MREAVELSLRHLEQADLRAMAVYLKTVPPARDGPMPARAEQRASARIEQPAAHLLGKGSVTAEDVAAARRF